MAKASPKPQITSHSIAPPPDELEAEPDELDAAPDEAPDDELLDDEPLEDELLDVDAPEEPELEFE